MIKNKKLTHPVQFRLENSDYYNLICKAGHLGLSPSDYVRFLVKIAECEILIQTLKDKCDGLHGKVPPARDLNKYLKEVEELENHKRRMWQELLLIINQRKIS